MVDRAGTSLPLLVQKGTCAGRELSNVKLHVAFEANRYTPWAL